jgi:hypothetical protein
MKGLIQRKKVLPMEGPLLEFFKTQGPWALLFVSLFLWELKQNKERERALIEVVNKLTDEVVKDLTLIKDRLGFHK